MADHDIASLVAQADLPAIAASFTEVRQRGNEYQARCVFHSPDNNPSLSIYHKGGKWNFKCFSCGEAGDALDWIEKLEGVPKAEAAKRLNGGAVWTPIAKAPQKARPPRPERIASVPPEGAGDPDMELRTIGKPSRTWLYRTASGFPLMHVARYETPEGKEIRAWCWAARPGEDPAWVCCHYNRGERPLYNLDKLAAQPQAPVMVVEGEKDADAAQAILPSYVVTTWPGGANGLKHADLSPLRGRRVDLWGDADEPGRDAMARLAAILADPKGLCCHGKMVDTTGLPDGFGAADWTGDSILEWLRSRAKSYAVPFEAPIEPPAEPEPPPAPDFPPEAAQKKPQKPKPKPRLAVVGNTALAPDEDAEPLPASMGEDALADHFADTHGEKWRHVRAWGAWFEWRGDGWHRDETGLVDRLAVQVTRAALYWQDALALTPDARRRVNSKRTAGNLRDLSAHDRRIAATVDQWDTDPWLLGVPGGVVNLKTGELLDALPEHYITKRTAIAPKAGECPLWTGLLQRITQGEQTMLDYLRRWCGYILTGETREECFAFIYGPAQTGKSTFIRVLADILGDYHRKASMETFTESRHERHAEELAVLVGARLVTSVETEEGKRWNESRIKALTGRDRIRARFMRENSFEFEPQFKLLIAGNHAPHLRNVDEAMRRRLHIIPFTNAIPMGERDDKLAEKLRAEYPQILAWMVRGALAWLEHKLGRPEQIVQAVDSYLESEDTLGEWLAECVDQDAQSKCQTSGAYKAFKSWAEKTGEYAPSQKRFVQALKERGFDTMRTGAARYIKGITLKTDGYEPPAYDVP